jgi:hypothetical protein
LGEARLKGGKFLISNKKRKIMNEELRGGNSDRKIDFREQDYIDSLRYQRVGVLDQESAAEAFALAMRYHSPDKVFFTKPIPGDGESSGIKYTVWKQLDLNHEEVLDRISGRRN